MPTVNPLARVAKSVVPEPLYQFTRRSYYAWNGRVQDKDRARRLERFEKEVLPGAGAAIGAGVGLNPYNLKLYSQNGEDGILLYLFSRIGCTSKTFIEFGCGDGVECNTAALSVLRGWRGVLFDGDERKAAHARAFYAQKLERSSTRVKVARHFIEPDNVNELFASQGMTGEIDLLSIDIDGNDFWVWQAIETVQPRVVAIEYNASFGPERSITVPYGRHFDYWRKHPSGFYHGASLRALASLASARGYLLAGCDSNGINAFFVRRDAAQGKLAAMSVADAWIANRYREPLIDTAQQFACIEHMDFVTI